MENQQRVNRRHPINLPAELKVEIVDCFPVENAVHFLANVPNRLIIHHCAPRIRRMFKKIYQIVIRYARLLPPPDFDRNIWFRNGHHYTPEMGIFLRYGAAHCKWFTIWRSIISDGFVGYPANFFDDLIKHYYETRVPAKAVRHLDIQLPLANPTPWPTAFTQPQAGEMKLEEFEVDNDSIFAVYILRNKHNPGIAFMVRIYFDGDANCYQQMTRFVMWPVKDVQSAECSIS